MYALSVNSFPISGHSTRKAGWPALTRRAAAGTWFLYLCLRSLNLSDMIESLQGEGEGELEDWRRPAAALYTFEVKDAFRHAECSDAFQSNV